MAGVNGWLALFGRTADGGRVALSPEVPLTIAAERFKWHDKFMGQLHRHYRQEMYFGS